MRIIAISRNIFCRLAAIILFFSCFNYATALGSATLNWYGPVSVAEDFRRFGTVQLAFDLKGTMHIAYTHPASGTQEPTDPDRFGVYYNTLTENHWSTPNMILYSPFRIPNNLDDVPMEHAAGVMALEYDVFRDRLVVLWGESSTLFVSSSPLAEAFSANQWQTQAVIQGSALSGSLVIDRRGYYHVVFGDRDRGLFYRQSYDGGESWTDSSVLYPVNPLQAAIGVNKLSIDENDGLIVTWEENWAANNWNPMVVWYGKIDSETQTFINYKELMRSEGENTVAWPNISFGPESIQVITWSRGVGSLDGRYEQWSYDGGATWQEPKQFFSDERGRAGFSYVVWDSQGQAYLLSTGQTRVSSAELRYAVRNGDVWSSPTQIDEVCEFISLALYRGQNLHVICQGRGSDTVLRMKHWLTILPGEPLPLPTLPPIFAENQLVITQTKPIDSQKDEPDISIAIDTDKALNYQFTDEPLPTVSISGPLVPFMTSMSLVLIVFIVTRLRSRK